MNVPSGNALLRVYRTFDGNRQICRRMESPGMLLVKNQCAIRMSVALGRSNCGFNFDSWPNRRSIHSPNQLTSMCRELPPHITSSSGLVKYLMQLGMRFEFYDTRGSHMEESLNRLGITRPQRSEIDFTVGLSKTRIREGLRGRMGIIYFGRCFSPAGSHIDFWNKTHSMNRVLRRANEDSLGPRINLFARTEGVIAFLPTP